MEDTISNDNFKEWALQTAEKRLEEATIELAIVKEVLKKRSNS